MAQLHTKPSIVISAAAPGLPLVLGGCIYLLWRSTSLLMFRWFDAAGLLPAIAEVRLFAAFVRPHLPTWFIYSLPDAAWVACGVLLFAAIWSGSSHPVRHFWVLLAPSLALGGEFAQLFRLLPGTFDMADVTTCTLLSAISVVLANRLFGYAIRSHQAEPV
jgi:hypothetical protein